MPSPNQWAGFHHPTTKRNVNAPTAHPSRDPMLWFTENKCTAREPAYVTLIEDHAMSVAGSISGLLDEFTTKAGVSDFETVIGVAVDTPSTPPASFPERPTRLDSGSRISRQTSHSPTEYLEYPGDTGEPSSDGDRFMLLDDVSVGCEVDDERMSQQIAGSEREKCLYARFLGV